MSDLEWKDPPPVRHAGRTPSPELLAVAAELRSRPGEWALVKSAVSAGTAHHWRVGKAAAFRPGEFEFVVRNTDRATQRADIYGRYIGTAP